MSCQISSIEGNGQKLDGGSMFGNAPKKLWEKWAPPDEHGRIELACRALLIECEGKRILCETGIGGFFEPRLADRFGVQSPDQHLLIENLKAVGVQETDIDYVILSHLHFDHAGGLLPTYAETQSGAEGLKFPNAQYIVGKTAWERANSPHLRDRASFLPNLNKKLAESGRMQIVETERLTGVFENRLSFFFSDGHTPGQMHTQFKGDEKTVIFVGDLIPGTHWVHLPITMGYDRYPEKLIDEKKTLYEGISLNSTLLFYTHDPKVCLSCVKRDEKGRFRADEEASSLSRQVI